MIVATTAIGARVASVGDLPDRDARTQRIVVLALSLLQATQQEGFAARIGRAGKSRNSLWDTVGRKESVPFRFRSADETVHALSCS
jgi:hypothetical protein